MSTMDCSQFLEHISEWVEGQEVPGARDHSRTCANCRGLAEDLGTIRLSGATLLEADTEPSSRVWLAIRAQLEREGLIRPGSTTSLERPGWLSSIFSFVPRPVFASAYVCALVALGFALSGSIRAHRAQDFWLQATQSNVAPLNAQLADAEQSAVASLASFSPDVTSDLRRNLTIVDNDIALCEKSVQENPESEIARDYLYSAYQQKADLLAQIGEHGEEGQ